MGGHWAERAEAAGAFGTRLWGALGVWETGGEPLPPHIPLPGEEESGRSQRAGQALALRGRPRPHRGGWIGLSGAQG